MNMTQFRDCLNFRDLGGYKTKDGKTIKPGFFYRSGGLYLLNEDEKKEFEKLGIKGIVELRTRKEWIERPDPEFKNTKRIEYNGKEFKLGENIDFSPNGMLQTGDKAIEQFEKILAYNKQMPYENEAFQLMFKEIKQNNVPILFHCFSGKDRTGVAALLILGLLNVSREVIVEDFLLSNQFYRHDLKAQYDACAIDLEKHPETKRLVTMTYGVNEEIIQGVYDEVMKRSGSFENYFINEHGYTLKDIETIRNTYTY